MIKARLDAGERYFENLIRQFLLDNPHRSTLVLEPDFELKSQWETEEAANLAAAQSGMDAAERQAIISNTETLRRLQVTPDSAEALATLPGLELSDLERTGKTIPLILLTRMARELLYHDIFTNGILYLDLAFDLHSLPAEDLPYANLLGRALLEMGTDKEDFVSLSQRIGSKTGGIHHSLFTSAHREGGKPAVWFMLRSKATLDYTDDLLAIRRCAS